VTSPSGPTNRLSERLVLACPFHLVQLSRQLMVAS
jgi:hypothetical protein